MWVYQMKEHVKFECNKEDIIWNQMLQKGDLFFIFYL